MNIVLASVGVILALIVAWFLLHVQIVRSHAAKFGQHMSAGAAAKRVLRDMKRVFVDGKKPEMMFPASRMGAMRRHGDVATDGAPVRGMPSVIGHGPGKRPAKRAKQRKKH